MRRPAKESLLSAILLGALLAASAPVAADEVTDSSITSWVNEALRHDPLVPASEISVSTQEGVVTLSGRVDNLATKNRVDRQASKIRGVREVLNELTVAPSPLSDTDIVYAVRRRILNDATIVLFGDGRDWHGKSLARAFKRHGIAPLSTPLNACGFSTETATGLFIPGLGDRLPEGAFVRFIPGGSFETVTL
ncbi:MAG: BON domain-containing protein, partial [Gemmatimonadales bacterium]